MKDMRKFSKTMVIILFLAIFLIPVLSFASSETDDVKTSDTETSDKGSITFFIVVAISSAFAMAIASIGAAFAQSATAKKALEGTARQPEASGKIQLQMILALVFIETLAIYTLVVILILLFANPFTKYLV
jgi:F-type H+-transporting ATPase subunit c